MTNTSRKSRSRRIIRLLLISLITVMLTLLAVEIVVRAVPLYPDTFAVRDSQRGWRYEPNYSGMWVNALCLGQIRNYVTLNSHALHDVEHGYDKLTDVRRVLILGDSVVASFEVPLEQAFFRRLEDILNEGDVQYEVIAAGHQGYGTDLEVLYYEQEGYRYQADLVLLLMQPHNDFRDNQRDLRQSDFSGSPYFTLEDGELVLHEPDDSAPYYPLHDFLSRTSKLYALLRARLALLSPPTLDEATLERLFDEAWPLTFALVDRLREEVEADGAQFGAIVEQSFLQPADFRAEMHGRIGEYLDELDIPYLSLLTAFDEAGRAGENLRYPCDTHWTAQGHTLAAETIAPFVRGFWPK
jgi:hypothetical protein